MEGPFFFFALIATVAVLVILLFGLGGFASGSDFSKRNANKVMQWRIMAQGFAVLMIVLAMTFSGD
ncbi:MAG: twin transmembrane helix small protein [Pseudomonadota bacterium]